MKALVGSWDNRPYRLLAENTALRNRVAELQTELAETRQELDSTRAMVADSLASEVRIDVSEMSEEEVALSR